MAVRPPRDLRLENGASALDYELLEEKAAALGRLGAKGAAAIARLHASEAGDERRTLVADAAHAVWCYFIQREVCGLRDHRPVIVDLDIPREVLIRLGAAPRA